MEALKAFIAAIGARDAKAVKSIARLNPHLLQFETTHGWPLMHRCLANDCGDKELAELYLRFGGDPLRKTNSGVSLVFLAASSFNGERIADVFQRAGARMSDFEKGQLIITHELDEEKAASGIMAILSRYPKVTLERGDQGYTLLHHASRHHSSSIKVLLDQGADLNALTFTGRSVLGLFGNPTNATEAVYYSQLVEKGARYTPSEEIIRDILRGNNDEVTKVLRSKKRFAHSWIVPHGPLLHWAAWMCTDAQIVKAIISNGVDPSIPNEDGETALHRALHRTGDIKITEEIVLMLLASGVDINACSNNGEAPIHVAAESPYEELIKLLVDRGAEINVTTKDGKTALDLVYSMRFLGFQALARWLKSKGAVSGVARHD